MIEILIAVLAGVLTIGAPCILPLLPILLGASVGRNSNTRPFFITFGFVISFAVIGLTISVLTLKLGVNPNTLRYLAIGLLSLFGLFMVFPKPFEILTSYLSGFINKANAVGSADKESNKGGFILGLMLGVIWTPCAGPVLGAILTLIATSTDMVRAGILLLSYAVGAGIPMLAIAYGGQFVTTKVRAIAPYSARIQQVFGVVIIVIAGLMFFQYDTLLQTKLLEKFPNLFLNSKEDMLIEYFK
jgi:cytochrome c biogenesis protein CcdA